MPESTRGLTPDPVIPPTPEPPLPVRATGRKKASKEAMDDHLIAELLAAEASAMAEQGFIPAEAPAPSPNLNRDVRDVWAESEARLEANGTQGTLAIDSRVGNTRDLAFYPSTSQVGRVGLWLLQGCAGGHHFRNESLSMLAENTRYLPALEQLLGVRSIQDDLRLAATEHVLRQAGML